MGFTGVLANVDNVDRSQTNHEIENMMTKKKKRYEDMKVQGHIYMTYTEDSRGGEVLDGYEDSDWPCYDTTYYDFNPIGFYLERPTQLETRQLDVRRFKPQVGKQIFVVIVRYGSGCTFSSSSGNWTFFDVYETAEEALAAKDFIYKDYKDNPRSFENKSHKYPYTGTWKGYFESLEDVEIHACELKDKAKPHEGVIRWH